MQHAWQEVRCRQGVHNLEGFELGCTGQKALRTSARLYLDQSWLAVIVRFPVEICGQTGEHSTTGANLTLAEVSFFLNDFCTVMIHLPGVQFAPFWNALQVDTLPNIGNGLHFFVPSVTIVLFLITDETDVTDPLLHSEERRSDNEEPEEALSGCSPRRTPPREESSP
ncbi:MAG TPA: hypothetical protein VEL31_03990 [Ktedonobacteraceae bacterium]|nr:hypothetical protein [Ktedonobacteraceae bacterium]